MNSTMIKYVTKKLLQAANAQAKQNGRLSAKIDRMFNFVRHFLV